jgi:hypothetical protein
MYRRALGSWVSQAASTGLFADRVAPPPAGGRGDGQRSVPGCRPRRSDAARRSRWATASGMAGGASWKGCGAPAPAAYRAWATWRTPRASRSGVVIGGALRAARIAHPHAGGRGDGPRWRRNGPPASSCREPPAVLVGRGQRRSGAAALARGHIVGRDGRTTQEITIDL